MIKLIIFIIILLIIYFVITRIKLVHINTLPDEQRTELNNRSKIRSMLVHNHVKCSDNSTNSLENFVETFLPKKNISIDKFIKIIKSENLDSKYNFNLPSLPVTYQYPDSSNKKLFEKYSQHIRKDIDGWKEYSNFKLTKIRPILIKKTENEFIITLNVEINLGKTYYLQLCYYGCVSRSDDFYVGKSTEIQLVGIKRISKSEFSSSVQASNNPFMSMEQQMAYVKKVNQMHDEE